VYSPQVGEVLIRDDRHILIFILRYSIWLEESVVDLCGVGSVLLQLLVARGVHLGELASVLLGMLVV